ncbi:unnamed protein product, partial [Heterosigma akashiwo]
RSSIQVPPRDTDSGTITWKRGEQKQDDDQKGLASGDTRGLAGLARSGGAMSRWWVCPNCHQRIMVNLDGIKTHQE